MISFSMSVSCRPFLLGINGRVGDDSHGSARAVNREIACRAMHERVHDMPGTRQGGSRQMRTTRTPTAGRQPHAPASALMRARLVAILAAALLLAGNIAVRAGEPFCPENAIKIVA